MLSPGSDSAFHREISKHFPKCSGLFSLGYRWGNEPQKGSVTCLKSPGRAAAELGLEPTNSAAPGTGTLHNQPLQEPASVAFASLQAVPEEQLEGRAEPCDTPRGGHSTVPQ